MKCLICQTDIVYSADGKPLCVCSSNRAMAKLAGFFVFTCLGATSDTEEEKKKHKENADRCLRLPDVAPTTGEFFAIDKPKDRGQT